MGFESHPLRHSHLYLCEKSGKFFAYIQSYLTWSLPWLVYKGAQRICVFPSRVRGAKRLSRMKLWAREERRLRDHWQDWPGDQIPVRIEMDWIDGLNIEDVLRVIRVSNVKVRIVLKGKADQIRDGILRGLT